ATHVRWRRGSAGTGDNALQPWPARLRPGQLRDPRRALDLVLGRRTLGRVPRDRHAPGHTFRGAVVGLHRSSDRVRRAVEVHQCLSGLRIAGLPGCHAEGPRVPAHTPALSGRGSGDPAATALSVLEPAERLARPGTPGRAP